MTQIRAAQGNNLTEVMSDTINQVAGQFTEGINAMFAGFKSFGQNFNTGNLAANRQQQSSHNNHSFMESSAGEPPTADEIAAGRLEAQRRMDLGIPFGEEDLRAIGGN